MDSDICQERVRLADAYDSAAAVLAEAIERLSVATQRSVDIKDPEDAVRAARETTERSRAVLMQHRKTHGC